MLPQLMRAFRGTPHSVTGKTANMMMLGRELRLPVQLDDPALTPKVDRTTYIQELEKRLQQAHDVLREQQLVTRQEDTEEPLLFADGDLVLMLNKRRQRGENLKLQPKFVGPYLVTECFPDHTYCVERQGQVSIQNEQRLKLYTTWTGPESQVPGSREPALRPNMKGGYQRKESEQTLPPVTDQTQMAENASTLDV